MQSKEEVKHPCPAAPRRQEMYAMIEQWQQSRLSQKAWCLQSGVSYHIFHYWYKRYRDKNNIATGSSFAELKVQPPAESCMELLLPGGKRLLFHQPVSSDFLKAIIS